MDGYLADNDYSNDFSLNSFLVDGSNLDIPFSLISNLAKAEEYIDEEGQATKSDPQDLGFKYLLLPQGSPSSSSEVSSIDSTGVEDRVSSNTITPELSRLIVNAMKAQRKIQLSEFSSSDVSTGLLTQEEVSWTMGVPLQPQPMELQPEQNEVALEPEPDGTFVDPLEPPADVHLYFDEHILTDYDSDLLSVFGEREEYQKAQEKQRIRMQEALQQLQHAIFQQEALIRDMPGCDIPEPQHLHHHELEIVILHLEQTMQAIRSSIRTLRAFEDK